MTTYWGKIEVDVKFTATDEEHAEATLEELAAEIEAHPPRGCSDLHAEAGDFEVTTP